MKPEIVDFDKLWDYGDPAGTEEKFRLLTKEARDWSLDRRLELETQIVRTLGLQRKFEDAEVALEKIRGRLTRETSVAAIRYQLERGRVLNSKGEPQQSIAHFEKALDLAQSENEDFHAVDAAHMLGIVSDSERALDWSLRAIALAEQSRDERARGWLGALLNNTGWTYHDAGEYTKALKLFEKALEFRESRGTERPILVARWCIGRCLRSLGQLERALAIQEELARAYDENPKLEDAGYVDEERAECLHALSRESEAIPYFKVAYEKLSQDSWLVKNEPERIERLRKLGQAQ